MDPETPRPRNIVLVGLSLFNKLAWDYQLSFGETGYRSISSRYMIRERLCSILPAHSLNGDYDLVGWTGFPGELQFSERQTQYIATEQQVMQEILRRLEKEEGLVVVTTENVICLGREFWHELEMNAWIVNIETSESAIQEMYERFIKEPKPVIWGDIYQPQEGETQEESLARCYRELLATRSRAYAEIAHVTIPHDFVGKEGLRTQRDFIEAIKLRKD